MSKVITTNLLSKYLRNITNMSSLTNSTNPHHILDWDAFQVGIYNSCFNGVGSTRVGSTYIKENSFGLYVLTLDRKIIQ